MAIKLIGQKQINYRTGNDNFLQIYLECEDLAEFCKQHFGTETFCASQSMSR